MALTYEQMINNMLPTRVVNEMTVVARLTKTGTTSSGNVILSSFELPKRVSVISISATTN